MFIQASWHRHHASIMTVRRTQARHGAIFRVQQEQSGSGCFVVPATSRREGPLSLGSLGLVEPLGEAAPLGSEGRGDAGRSKTCREEGASVAARIGDDDYRPLPERLEYTRRQRLRELVGVCDQGGS